MNIKKVFKNVETKSTFIRVALYCICLLILIFGFLWCESDEIIIIIAGILTVINAVIMLIFQIQKKDRK